ncbi:MAG: UvrD-helicase domain-containing protein, partial [Desulfatiglandaceae bacterium]
MEFRIADTFTDSLARLTDQEQKAVKTTAFDLQMNPASPGMKFHRLEKARDPAFHSVRVNQDIRLIVHKSSSSLLLCYVDHHDKAYRWAEQRKLETHPKTGAAQLVEIRETVKEITVPKYVEAVQPPLFTDVSDDELLGYGVPAEWLEDVRQANEETVLELADHLPGEAAEALLDLATGVTPQIAQPVAAMEDPFAHPDAQRRFRVMSNVEELERALEYPWEKWTVFLHPAQRQLVEREYGGPARVSGSAGTGKTIVALHRAVFLAQNNPDCRVLLTTFSDALANALRTKLVRLISNTPRVGERLEIHAMNAIGLRLYELHFGRPQIASREVIEQLIKDAAGKVDGHKFSHHFLMTEWEQVVDAWQLETWEAYRDVARLGRKTRLPEKQRMVLWSIFEQVRSGLDSRSLITYPYMFSRLASELVGGKHPPFDYVVVDEAQDVSVPQLRFLAALGSSRPDSLFFAGDLGQRIFQQPFSWKSLGVDIRGRSRTLKINYRTSHQIRSQADKLLGPEISDVDGNKEDRRGTISVFNGPKPGIHVFDTPEAEIEAVGNWLSDRCGEGVLPHEIGIFVRSSNETERARSAVESAGLPFK